MLTASPLLALDIQQHWLEGEEAARASMGGEGPGSATSCGLLTVPCMLCREKGDLQIELADTRAKLVSSTERVNMHEKVMQQTTQRVQVCVGQNACFACAMSCSLTAIPMKRSPYDCIEALCNTSLLMQDLESSNRQLESRCVDLREASTGHEHRAKEAAAELSKSNQTIERISSDLQVSKEKLKRKQAIIVRQVGVDYRALSSLCVGMT
jgi:hypothetical protein